MTTLQHTPRPLTGPPMPLGRGRWYLVLALVAIAGLLAGLVAVFLLAGGDGATTPVTPSTITSVTTATTMPLDTATAVFPLADSAARFSDPVGAATAFATDFAGFADPVVGAFQQGDSRSGEVEIRPAANGPVSTVFVRQLGPDDSWWVLGAATASIRIQSPEAGEQIFSPVRLTGMSTAFEATVLVELREDGGRSLGSGYVMGGANGEMGPFDSTLAFSTPAQPYGALVMSTDSAENGQVWEIAVLRVRLGS